MESQTELETAINTLQQIAPLLQGINREDERWLGTAGCARRLGISIATLRKKLWAWKTGRVDIANPIGTDIAPYHPKGSDWRFEKNDIDIYIKKHKVE